MSNLRRKRGLVLAFSLLFPLLPLSCKKRPTVEYLKGNTMGTYYTVQYWESNIVRPQILTTEIETLLDEFENKLSNWRSGSWISQFNAAPANQFSPIPEYAYPVLELCLELAELSDGAFDPTISPLIELWGFGTQRGVDIPSKQAIQNSLAMTGFRKLVLDRENRALLKTQEEVQLNCSAVAKGYAVDLVARILENRGIQNFLINIGGEISAKGTNINGEVWRVGIRPPRPNGKQAKPEILIPLTDQSLATSGHSQRSFLYEGKRYSHILNGKTGFPVSAETASATVVAPTCALADGLATIALILNEAQMNELIESYDDVAVYRKSWHEQ